MAHTHYSGTGRMHSFKGILPSDRAGYDGQDRIRIQGATGEIAWRITKFQIVDTAPGTLNSENVVKIYREEQTTVDGVVNFNDDELLAAAVYKPQYGPPGGPIIFDNSLFSRNIHVTHIDMSGNNNSCNYYIELEEVKVSAAGMAQLAVAAARRIA